MPEFNEITHVWKTTFKNWRYSALGAAAAILFYILNVILNNFGNLKSIYFNLSFLQFVKFILTLIAKFGENIEIIALVNIIIVSLLFGILVSLLAFKVNAKKSGSNKAGAVGFMGAFVGALFSGCAACGIGLVSALGLGSGFLAIFPYEGIELSFLAILILLLTIFKISKDLTICDVCRVDLKIHKMKGGKN